MAAVLVSRGFAAGGSGGRAEFSRRGATGLAITTAAVCMVLASCHVFPRGK